MQDARVGAVGGQAILLRVGCPTTPHRVQEGVLGMTRISRILIESNRITILHRRYISTARCKHCGNELDLINHSAADVVMTDKLERVVRFEESPLPQTFGAWRHALFSRLLRSIGRAPPN
jgi:hypothetical protein